MNWNLDDPKMNQRSAGAKVGWQWSAPALLFSCQMLLVEEWELNSWAKSQSERWKEKQHLPQNFQFCVSIYTARFWAWDGDPLGHPCICGKGADPAAGLVFGSLNVQIFCGTGEGSLWKKLLPPTFILAPFSCPFLDKCSQTWCQNCKVLVNFCKAARMTHFVSQITDKTGGK